MRILKFAFLIVLLTAPEVIAQQKLEVIPLQNRMVEEVVPIIRPLLRRMRPLRECVSNSLYELLPKH